MERSGATENAVDTAKLLIGMVGAWGFEPQTPTVSSSTPSEVLWNQQALNLLSKIRTACTASTASTARSAHFCVPNCVPNFIARFGADTTRFAARSCPILWLTCPFIYGDNSFNVYRSTLLYEVWSERSKPHASSQLQNLPVQLMTVWTLIMSSGRQSQTRPAVPECGRHH